ncbi:hypothetical protein GCM10023148_12360 [Actinokineospora soli]
MDPEAEAALRAEAERTGPPRVSFRDVRPRLTLPEGVTTADILNELREDRC